jgi:Aminopeptidase P, N-terminal domain.
MIEAKEYARRRKRLMRLVGADAVRIVPAAPERVRNSDAHYARTARTATSSIGFYPVNADTSKKTDHGQKGVSCPSEESSATSSSGRPSA